MAYPGVDITLGNGNLGGVEAQPDGIAGLVAGVDLGASGITAGQIYTFNSLDDARASDFDQVPFLWRQVSEFYAAGGGKLHVMCVPNTETLEDICDAASTNFYAKKLLDGVNGEIRTWGACRLPGAGYTTTYTNGFDADAYAAIAKAHALCESKAAEFAPCRAIVEARDFQGNVNNLTDLKAAAWNRAGAVICSSGEAVSGGTHDKSASVGLVLGALSANPVQRKISRVKNGALPISEAFIADSTGHKKVEEVDIKSISEKGYICIRNFIGRTGYWFADDPTAAPATDDYSSISRGRVIDKAIRVAYDTYLNELNDEVEVDKAKGTIAPAMIKSYQGKIENALNTAMADEITEAKAFIDHEQNVLSTNKVAISISIFGVGYAVNFDINLGYTNPALN